MTLTAAIYIQAGPLQHRYSSYYRGPLQHDVVLLHALWVDTPLQLAVTYTEQLSTSYSFTVHGRYSTTTAPL